MKILQEFKEFAIRGNVIDLAVGIIIGAAFGKIVSSLVADIIMPLVGVFIGGIDFMQLKVLIHQSNVAAADAIYIYYGKFLQAILDFVIIAFVIFIMIRMITKIRTKFEKPVDVSMSELTKEEILLTEIRDILKEKE